MRITVTQKHIDKGDSTPSQCPVALACKDAYTKYKDICVWGDRICFYNKSGMERRVDSPESVARFVDAFDYQGRKSVAPFEFQLED